MNGLLVRASGVLLAAALFFGPAASGEVTLIGVGQIPGTATDLSGLKGMLKNAAGESIPANQLGSFGSAVTYTGAGNRYYAVNDRGFGDGTTRSSIDRFHVFEITVDPATKTVTPRLVETRMLTNEAGESLVGEASAFVAANPARNLRFDPEGLRIGRDGTLFISDEYGPTIAQFTPQGRRLRVLPVPPKFLAAKLSDSEEGEIKDNVLGRVSNKGMEGLAITPDGKALLGAVQAPLIQDGGLDGLNARLLRVDLDTGATREYVYVLGAKKNGLSEILAINDHQFLVIERDGKPGAESRSKRIEQIDINGATDVSAIGTSATNGLPAKGLPAGVKPVAKQPFIDLLAPKLGLAAKIPPKIEALTWGPDLPDGRHLLLVVSDNDLKPDEPSVFYAFAVDRSDLPGLEP